MSLGVKSVDNKIPLLGICLGMQLFADISEEFGDHNGLSFINGRVESINNHDLDGNRIKVPFIGWSKINLSNNKEAANSCLVGLENRISLFSAFIPFLDQNMKIMKLYTIIMVGIK